MKQQYTFEEIRRLPKAELHVHLDGSVRFETLVELMGEIKDSRKSISSMELEQELQDVRRSKNLVSYLKVFGRTISVMQTLKNLTRVVKELLEDAEQDGINTLEVRFCPTLHTQNGLTHTEIIETVLATLSAEGQKRNISTGIIVCALRQLGPEHSMAMAKLAVAYKESGVVGLDLAGNESASSASEHKEAFGWAKTHDLNRTIHAGEAMGPESIAQAIDDCMAERIGHGTRLTFDPTLSKRIKEKRIPLEICPSSNVHTGATPSLDEHPLNQYLADGQVVTINTDNRLMSQTTLSQEIWLCQNQFGWTQNDVDKIISNGIAASFVG